MFVVVISCSRFINYIPGKSELEWITALSLMGASAMEALLGVAMVVVSLGFSDKGGFDAGFVSSLMHSLDVE